MALFRLGRFAEAESDLRKVVVAWPESIDAHSILGMSLALQGRVDEAIAPFRRVLELDPNRSDAHNNLGRALHDLGRLEEAEASFREALRFDPGHAMALASLSALLSGREGYEELADVLRQVVRLRPDDVDARLRLGDVLVRLETFDEAATCYGTAVGLAPGSPGPHNGLGRALAGIKKYDEAVACFRTSLHLEPDQPDVCNNLGCALRDLGRPEEAEAGFREALRLDPGHAMALASLTRLLSGQGRHEELVDILRQAVRVRADDPQDRVRLARVLLRLERFDEAATCLEAAVALAPGSLGTRIVLGSALSLLGRFEEALRCYEQAVRLAPDQAPAHVNRSMIWLMHGDYARGWPEYDWRLEGKEYSPRQLPRPRWRGEPLGGRTILLTVEQGLGDTLQFIRYAPLVKHEGERVLMECQRSLVRLAETCAGIDRVVPVGEPLPDFDYYVPLLSLPGVFKTTLETVPQSVPYLAADPALVAHWAERLGLVEGLRVGIAWQGEPKHPRDRSRSFPLRSFEKLDRIDGVRLISLQRGPGVEQLRAPGDRFPVIDLGDLVDPGLKEMRDTPAIMMNLDLVIVPDSAPAHLAGALGVPVWIPLSFIPDFRWLLDREDSPWYPTARLFRRSRHGGWDEVFERMAEALAAMVASGRGPTR
jgi:tetratricopeptide (TPR) repeat protein